ncbi:MAG: sigma-70 family RNA polymerase sigma factor [Methylococcaceae bacterium]|jgi:RNA polymerase sigma factor (sigma-70 family)
MSQLYPEKESARLLVLVQAVRTGDKNALDQLVRALKDGIYGIALRMVTCPTDAEDVTQEVLIKIMIKLDSFRGDASLRTWAYRITVNHILDRRKSRVEELGLDFDMFGQDLAHGLSESSETEQELVQEVKLGCSLAMLTCLSREQRIAYILGEVFNLSSRLAAEIADVDEQVYRQRLSRARNQLESFTKAYCGVINQDNDCRCERRVEQAIKVGRVKPDKLIFAQHPRLESTIEEMDLLYSTASLMRSHPRYSAPERILEGLRELINDSSLGILNS